MPELGHFSGDAEGTFGRDRLLALVRDEVDVGLAILAVGEKQVALRRGEIRRNAEHFFERLTPNDLARAIGMLGHGFAVAVSPHLAGELRDFLIDFGIAGQARGAQRLRSVNNRPVADEFGDLLQDWESHPVAGRQHQHAVAHATRGGDPAVLHLHEIEQDVGIADIVIESLRNRRGDLLVDQAERRPFAVKVAEVGLEAALLEQRLAPRDVIDPRRALVPPSVRALEVHSPMAHDHSRLPIEPRLVGVAMENEEVDAHAKCPVPLRLDQVGIGPPQDVGTRSERFR